MSIAKLTTPYTNPYVVSLDDVDLIKIRSLEAAPLTHEDLDDNFANLAYKINDLIEVIGGSSAVITADADGNVGIGTADPDEPLHIESGSDSLVKLVQVLGDSGSDKSHLEFFSKEGEVETRMGRLGIQMHATDSEQDEALYLEAYDSNNVMFRAGGNTRMLITNDGNVGIGTTTPNYNLHIAGGTPALKLEGSQPRIWLSENDQTDLNTLIRNNNSSFQIDTVADDDSFITNRLTILNTNGNVGIGTTNPSSKITAISTVDSTFGNVTPSVSDCVISLANQPTTEAENNHASLQFNLNAGTHNHVASISLVSESATLRRGALAFCIDNGTNRPEAMRIDSSGNVGIGSTSPSHKLTIGSPTTAGTTSQSLKIYRGSDDGGQNLEIGYNNITITRDTNDLDDPQSSLAFNQKGRDGTRTVMQISSNGNVGIGTTNPQEAFHLKGDHKRMFIGSDDYNLFSLGRRSSTEPDTAYLQMNDEGTKKVALDTNGDSYFLGGNLGVGTDNPGALLTIEGTGSDNVQAGNLLGVVSDVNGKLVDIRLEGKAQTTGATMAGSVGFDPNNNCVYLASDNDQTLNVTGGNVGIGTTSPSAALHIKTSSLDQEGLIVENSLGNQTAHIGHLTDGTAYFKLADETGQNHTLLRDNGHSYLNALDGNVGIGTTTPDAKLEIAGSAIIKSSGPVLILKDEDGGDVNTQTGFISYRDNSNVERGYVGFGSAATKNFTIKNSIGDIILSGGNVGIGTSNPKYKLSVLGDFGVGDNTLVDGTVDGVVISSTSTSPYTNTITHTDNGLEFGNNAVSVRDFLFNNGNVGIGTTTPAGLLELYKGSGSNGVNHLRLLTSAGGGLSIGALSDDTNPTWAFSVNSGESFAFRTSSTEKMRITSNGNVGIGTTEPKQKLFLKDGNFGVDGTGYIIQRGTANTTGEYGIIHRTAYYSGATGNHYGRVRINTSYNSSTNQASLKFYTSPGGANSDRLAFSIGSSGDVACQYGLDVQGNVSKGSGTFKIDHPLPEKSETHHLVHSFIEGPQADNIYRGKVELVAGKAEVNIDAVSGMTEGTFVALNRDIQAFTSNESDWDAVRGKVEGNKLIIECQNAESTATVSWLVIGERQDEHMLKSKTTDENGKLIVEPLKPEPEPEYEEMDSDEVVTEEPVAEEAPVEEPQAESDSNITTKEDGKEYIRIGDKEYEVLGRNEDGSLILDDDVTNNA